MWIFIHRLPREACIIAPRGLYTTRWAGTAGIRSCPHLAVGDDFLPAVEKLSALLAPSDFHTLTWLASSW